ncbi:MAG: type II toxin-antitoxin system VapC family toxin [Selenomonadaceae bacterium]|nr:type II toxin-antitoxin system VapC family toxin [Selenomonadaceae bacterium]
MKYLLDTHILIWTLTDTDNLSQKARNKIEDRRNKIFYSTVSIWEVTIKHLLHPKQIPCSGYDLLNYCDKSDLFNLPLKNHHVIALEKLKRANAAPPHKDPFDQILLSQALAEDMIFLTHDKTLEYYDGVNVEIV